MTKAKNRGATIRAIDVGCRCYMLGVVKMLFENVTLYRNRGGLRLMICQPLVRVVR